MKSPIEHSLHQAIRRSVPDTFALFDFTPGEVEHFDIRHADGVFKNDEQLFGEDWIIHRETRDKAPAHFYLYSDVPILTYRADFIFVVDSGTDPLQFAIECDGHEFHDRTKQQATYDRARDRELLIAGIPTMRFTGSDIFHDADRCARDVFALALAMHSHRAGDKSKTDVQLKRAIRFMRDLAQFGGIRSSTGGHEFSILSGILAGV